MGCKLKAKRYCCKLQEHMRSSSFIQ